MSNPIVVALVVHCTQSLLLCREVPLADRDARFADMPACEAALPALKLRHTAEVEEHGGLVMAKCRFLLEQQTPRSARQRPSS